MGRPKVIQEWIPTRGHINTSEDNVRQLLEQGARPNALMEFVNYTEEKGARKKGPSALLAKVLRGEASFINEDAVDKYVTYINERSPNGSSGENLG